MARVAEDEDGQHLQGRDAALRSWSIRPAVLLLLLCEMGGPNQSKEEWENVPLCFVFVSSG